MFQLLLSSLISQPEEATEQITMLCVLGIRPNDAGSSEIMPNPLTDWISFSTKCNQHTEWGVWGLPTQQLWAVQEMWKPVVTAAGTHSSHWRNKAAGLCAYCLLNLCVCVTDGLPEVRRCCGGPPSETDYCCWLSGVPRRALLCQTGALW